MKTADAAESLSYVGLRYMTSFRCIGPDCEDSCCGEWAVTVDDARHEALRRTMGQTEQGRAEFCAAVEYRVEGGGRVVALERVAERLELLRTARTGQALDVRERRLRAGEREQLIRVRERVAQTAACKPR